MSKFCHVISKNRENQSKLQAPLTFQQLENLIAWLGKETLEFEDDFNRKASYVAERDVKLSENNEALTKLYEAVQKYAANFSAVENEIAAQEKTLFEISEIVEKMQQRQGTSDERTIFRSEYAAVLALIQALDAQMLQAAADMESINELIAAEKTLPTSKATQKVITSILSMHLDLLLHIERSLAHLHENCESVESQLRVLRMKQSQLFED